MTLEELAPPIPENGSAAVALEPAFQELGTAWERHEREYPISGGPIRVPRAESKERIHRIAEIGSRAIDLARAALKHPRYSYGVCHTIDPWSPSERLVDLDELTCVLGASALAHAHEKKSVEAVEDILTIFSLAHTLDGEPVMQCKLVMFNICEMGVGAAEDVSKLIELPVHVRRTLIQQLHTFDFQAQMTQALMGERVIGLAGIHEVLTGSHDRERRPPAWSPWVVRPLLFWYLWDKARYLKRMAELIAASRLSPWEAYASFPRFPEYSFKQCLHATLSTPLSEDLLDNVAFYHRLQRALALRDAAILGLTCEIYRVERGSYPSELDELAPEYMRDSPPDPFTGEPFMYKYNGEGMIIYSLGDNLRDDGGVCDYDADRDDLSWEGRPSKTAAREARSSDGR